MNISLQITLQSKTHPWIFSKLCLTQWFLIYVLFSIEEKMLFLLEKGVFGRSDRKFRQLTNESFDRRTV